MVQIILTIHYPYPQKSDYLHCLIIYTALSYVLYAHPAKSKANQVIETTLFLKICISK